MLKVVIDTNAILRCISTRSVFSIVLDELYNGNFELYITNDILFEYEEKITEVFSKETLELLLGFFTLLPNVIRTDIFYHLNLITADEDDNKFIDCAFAGNVHFIVTNDKHFNVLKTIPFPVLKTTSLEEFTQLLNSKNFT